MYKHMPKQHDGDKDNDYDYTCVNDDVNLWQKFWRNYDFILLLFDLISNAKCRCNASLLHNYWFFNQSTSNNRLSLRFNGTI